MPLFYPTLSFATTHLWRASLFPVSLMFNYGSHLYLNFFQVEAVERAAGLTLFSDHIKQQSKHICKTTKCDVIVRRFDDAQKKGRKAIAAP